MTAPYVTGTVSVTANSAVVTGNGTAWATAGVVGGLFFPDRADGNPIPILSIDSNTQLTLAFPWRGATAAGQAYGIIRDTAYLQQLSSNAQKLAEYISRLDNSALAAIAGLAGTMAADKVPYASGPNAMAWATLTAYARSFLDKTDGAGVYGALGEIPNGQLPSRLKTTGTTVTDLNAIGDSGFYLAANTAANHPTGTGTIGIIHGQINTGTAWQIAITSSGATFRRTRAASVWGAWSMVVTNDTLLGTVSQSGGVPTGRVIERGSNANGQYIRLADGTMWCWGTGTDTVDTLFNNFYGAAAGAIYVKNVAITLPASFVDSNFFGGAVANLRGNIHLGSYMKSTSGFSIGIGHTTNGAQVPFNWSAIGRWF